MNYYKLPFNAHTFDWHCAARIHTEDLKFMAELGIILFTVTRQIKYRELSETAIHALIVREA